MIVDTSAIMTILLGEPERADFLAAMVASDRLTMSSGNWVELQAVLTRRGDPALEQGAERLFGQFAITIAPVPVAQAEVGRAAYRTYGRGSGHPAQLNFGDCFAYALSKETGEPLLFKGNDFSKTDVEAASLP